MSLCCCDPNEQFNTSCPAHGGSETLRLELAQAEAREAELEADCAEYRLALERISLLFIDKYGSDIAWVKINTHGYVEGALARQSGAAPLERMRKMEVVINQIRKAIWDKSVTGHIIVGEHSWRRIQSALTALDALAAPQD